ncbi:MAG: hypothetical protein J7463_09930 [Roseiflexus sp.]|jgi:hypothetical protein|nr:hypothetical protein [Roseiflexus sp.]MBO9335813.1 hypothetical protein [Roseiflexus sp.]MBO9341293.1 hypothetical protein [Roseiflexus sp.]MBO9365905.1 hypothetical protein [Roseiflexus sp.]MBO9381896.1 hypothetical protein [Roseiflexus sp.]
MLAKISTQIDLTVDARFSEALDLLRTLREMQNPRNRRSSAEQALASFLEVTIAVGSIWSCTRDGRSSLC